VALAVEVSDGKNRLGWLSGRVKSRVRREKGKGGKGEDGFIEGWERQDAQRRMEKSLFGRATRDEVLGATAAQLLILKSSGSPRLGRVEVFGDFGIKGTCFVAGSRPSALPKRVRTMLAVAASRTFLRRHRDEALQERGLVTTKRNTRTGDRGRGGMLALFYSSRDLACQYT
jgi:hypothetical protein